jgi:hypothetical protein
MFQAAILFAVVLIVVSVTASYYTGYGAGYANGYNKGQIHGQIEQLIQSGSTLTLPPGGNMSIPLTTLDFASQVQNLTISVFVQFVVSCYPLQNINPCPGGTAELYFQRGLGSLFNTGYTNAIRGNFSFMLNTKDNPSTTYAALRANPQNQVDVEVYWEVPLILTITPQLAGPPFP